VFSCPRPHVWHKTVSSSRPVLALTLAASQGTFKE
jgi:hypothetical protein